MNMYGYDRVLVTKIRSHEREREREYQSESKTNKTPEKNNNLFIHPPDTNINFIYIYKKI